MKWHVDGRRGRLGGHAGAGVFAAGLPGRWRRLCPGAEVAGAGVPGQEAFQCRAGEGFPAVAAAFVEVGGEPGQEVQAGHLGGGGDGPDHGGVPGGVPVAGAAGVLPGHDRAADHSLGGVVIEADHRVVAVRGEAVPFAVQGGERFLRRLGQAGGGHLLLARLVDRGERGVPRGLRVVQPRGGGRLVPRRGCGGGVPRGRELLVGGVQALDPLQPCSGPVRQLGGVRVPGPHEIPADMRPAVQVHQAVGLLPGGLVNGVEVTGNHQAPRPAVLVRSELAGVLVDAGVAGQDRPGPRRVHDEADGVRAEEHPQPPLRRPGPVPRREHPPRRLIRVQVPGAPRPLRDRLRDRGQQRPGLRARPGQGGGRDVRSLTGQALHQRVQAPPRREPLHQEHRDERVREQALPDRLRRAGRRHRRRHPATAGPLIAAAAVRRQPHDHLPVQLLPGPVIAQRRERLPALRAAVPAPGKIPEHLEPGQMRVIPPPCPSPRAAFPPRAGPGTLPAGGIARRLRARPLRRPPEHHPLQNRQVSA